EAQSRSVQLLLQNSEVIKDPKKIAELIHILWSRAHASKFWQSSIYQGPSGADDLLRFVGHSALSDSEKYQLLNEILSTGSISEGPLQPHAKGLAELARFRSEPLYLQFLREHSDHATGDYDRHVDWQQFAGLSTDSQIEVLRMYAFTGHHVWETLQRFGIPRARWMEVLGNYNVHPRDTLTILDALPALNLSRAERRSLAHTLIDRSPREARIIAERLGLPEADRFELALDFALHHRDVFLDNDVGILRAGSQPFALTDPSHQLAVARQLIAGMEPGQRRSVLQQQIGQAYPLSALQLQRVEFSADPLSALEQVTDVSTSSHVEDPAALAQLRKKIQAYAKAHPDVIPPSWVPVLWDRISSQETGFKLLDLLYRVNKYNINRPAPKDSLQFLTRELGYHYEDLAHSAMSNDRLSTLYTLSLDIRENLSTQPFAAIPIDPQIFSSRTHHRAFTDFLQRARDYHFLRGNNDRSWLQLTSELNLRARGITPENLPILSRELERRIVNVMKELFKGENLELKYEDLAVLESSWGDLGPIKTLVARFHGRPDGKDEIPVVARIFSTASKATFEQYKFEGHPEHSDDQEKAKAQLAVLKTEEQKHEWRKIRTRLGVYVPGETRGISQAQQLDGARRVVRNELLTNLEGGKANVPPTRVQEIIRAGLAREDHLSALNRLLETTYADSNPADAKREIVTAIGERILTADFKEAEQLAKRLRVWSDALVLPQQTQHDIIALVEPLKNGNRGAEASKMLVFTTTFHHPKMLLMVGDLVGTHTCQSFSTGGIIQTLPGYVIDANIQGVASFSLNQKDFSSRNDFDRVVSAREKGVPIEIAFDAGKRIVRFKFSIDATSYDVTSQPLGFAYLRHMVKLGETDAGTPGVTFEPAKTQPSPAQSMMDQQAAEIKGEIAGAIGGVADQKMKVVGSRNPHGVYSDRSGGVIKGNYEIRQ
ncbi:MAG: hypothetical protein HY537_11980, partial [Deltaproteobacteria bacterium]|nr:hypothetical protein [Deltaproteobacteria bacterium]